MNKQVLGLNYFPNTASVVSKVVSLGVKENSSSENSNISKWRPKRVWKTPRTVEPLKTVKSSVALMRDFTVHHKSYFLCSARSWQKTLYKKHYFFFAQFLLPSTGVRKKTSMDRRCPSSPRFVREARPDWLQSCKRILLRVKTKTHFFFETAKVL